jgi:light-regulated signal transduction histidine kinase (bacteriophytochrome)
VAEKLTQCYPNAQLIQMQAESYFGTQIVSSSGQITGVVAVLGRQPLRIGSSSKSMLDVFANRISVELDRKVAMNRLKELNDSLERRVAERTKELSDINEELEAFSYSVSHDLRAPLTVIEGFGKLLLEQHADVLEDSGVHYLQQIAGSTRRMNSLIDALLSLARISRQPLRLRDVDLTALAVETVEKLQTAQPERRVVVAIATHVTAYADQELLAVVLDNLLSNAWKFTAKTSNPRIEFGTIESASEHVYYVRDNGAGFDSQHADKLFQPFHRQHHERDFPGTGIGLATVARIVRHHGGRVWAEAAAGLGASFYFTLPLANTPAGRVG